MLPLLLLFVKTSNIPDLGLHDLFEPFVPLALASSVAAGVDVQSTTDVCSS